MDMDAREIYIQKNLILPRSLKDTRIDGKVPFRLNMKYDPKEYETPPDKLMKKKARINLKQRKDTFIEEVRKRKEIDEL